jgi:hypothetical protein
MLTGEAARKPRTWTVYFGDKRYGQCIRRPQLANDRHLGTQLCGWFVNARSTIRATAGASFRVSLRMITCTLALRGPSASFPQAGAINPQVFDAVKNHRRMKSGMRKRLR